MDWGNLTDSLPVIATIIGLILLQFFLRRRRSPVATQQEIVQSILSDVRVNLRLAEVLTSGEQIKRLITTNWKINRNKLEFLDQSVQSNLTDAFTIAEDYNQQVAASRKYRSNSYIAAIDAEKLRSKLAKSKEGLEQWLLNTTGTREPAEKAGIFDDLIGKH